MERLRGTVTLEDNRRFDNITIDAQFVAPTPNTLGDWWGVLHLPEIPVLPGTGRLRLTDGREAPIIYEGGFGSVAFSGADELRQP